MKFIEINDKLIVKFKEIKMNIKDFHDLNGKMKFFQNSSS